MKHVFFLNSLDCFFIILCRLVFILSAFAFFLFSHLGCDFEHHSPLPSFSNLSWGAIILVKYFVFGFYYYIIHTTSPRSTIMVEKYFGFWLVFTITITYDYWYFNFGRMFFIIYWKKPVVRQNLIDYLIDLFVMLFFGFHDYYINWRFNSFLTKLPLFTN